jgi:hypothetical protein
MAKQTLNLGASANDGTGTTLRVGGDMINDNFDELYLRQVTSTSDPTVNDDTGDGYVAGLTLWTNTATGQSFVLRSSTAAAAVWVALAAERQPKHISGRWYPFWPNLIPAASTNAPATTSTYFLPFSVNERVSISDLGIWSSTAGTNAKLGIYANDLVTNQPTGTALATTANIDVTGTGAFKTGSVNTGTPYVVEPGRTYWMAFQSDNTAFRPAVQNGSASQFWALLGSSTVGNLMASASTTFFTLSATGQTYGTMGDVTSATFVYDAATNRCPLVVFKVS